jgi:CubicO group peptidase (beta-lactamase class C family)
MSRAVSRRLVGALFLFSVSLVGRLRSQVGAAAPPAAGAEARLNGFDQWAEGLIKEWNVPGMAVGAIKDGKVVILKGFGFRNLEEKQPVTPRTLMAIGSNTKSFTVVLMSQLVDEGKLDWDKPVVSYLPDFQLKDEYATKNFRVKDLVTHVSGLPRHDDLWYGRSTTRKEIFSRLKYLEPSTSFRGRWQYNNLMFITAGYLVEQLTGKSWDALIRERIFQPLEMKRSITSTNDMESSGDFSYPYLLFDGKIGRVPYRNLDNAGPAGSINSSVEEMLHYVQMHINQGEWNGRRILSARNDLKMQSPQSVVTERMVDPELGPETYGLATWVSSYRGHKWVQHGGGIDGFISQMAWLPNDNIGVVVLTNMSGPANPVPNTVVKRVFDDLLGLEPIDWNARARKDAERGQKSADSTRRALAAERVANTRPSHPLADYAGTYSHPAYGKFEIQVKDGGLALVYEKFSLPLTHYHYDVFQLDPATLRGAPVTGLVQFLTATNGKIDRVAIPFESAIDPIILERQ